MMEAVDAPARVALPCESEDTRGDRIRRPLHRLLIEHAPLLLIVLLYAAARFVVWSVTGAEALAPRAPNLQRILYWPLVGIGSVVFLSFHLVRLTFTDRTTGGLLTVATWQKFWREYFASYRGAAAVAFLTIYSVLTHTFGPVKRAIPEVNPFSWDSTLASVDARIHGGTDPWVLLHPLLGHPMVTLTVQNIYTFGWFVPLSGMIFLAAWAGNRERRAQILLVLVLSWILIGSLAATVLSSVGPAFYHLLTGDGRFLPLLDYLQTVDARYGLPALRVQEMLWAGHVDGGAGELGISAMPSMHVAMATLVALAACTVSRWLGSLMVLMGVVIMLGSVHLAWHYAVDGYVSILGVLLLWWGCGRFVAWYGSHTRAFDVSG